VYALRFRNVVLGLALAVELLAISPLGAQLYSFSLTGDVTGTASGSTGSAVTTISAGVVTYAKMQNEAASSLLGNPTGSPTAPSAITLGAGLGFSGTTLLVPGGAITNAMLVNASTTVNGQTCTLGSACTVTATPSGVVSLALGGTNANLTASNGGVFYSTGSAGAILAGTATAGLPLISGASGAPAWGTLNGTGNLVGTTSPSFTTPNLGAATGTSLSDSGTITAGTGQTYSVSLGGSSAYPSLSASSGATGLLFVPSNDGSSATLRLGKVSATEVNLYAADYTGVTAPEVFSLKGSQLNFYASSYVGSVTATGLNSIAIGATTAAAGKFTTVTALGFIANGSVPTPTGSCAINTQLGGNTAGSFKANGACAAGTVILTFATTAPNGWFCTAHDLTTVADAMNQTAYSTTACTFTGTMVSADLVTFNAVAF
jgi:hypothetical protein